jgi:hypothetical protein
MLKPIDQYFLSREEPARSCLQFLREHLLAFAPEITESWKYGMPFYCYNGKMFCYLWTHKKYRQPYIGFVEGNLLTHPDLIQEKRARMKILLLDAGADIQVATINRILEDAIALYNPSQ